MPRILITGLVVLLYGCSGEMPSDHLEISYIANAGVRFRSGDTTVFSDAFFNIAVPPGVPPRLHDHLSREDELRLESGQTPFGCADLILVTHEHDDHYTSDAVRNHLEHCEQALVVMPADLSGKDRSQYPALDADRIFGLDAEDRPLYIDSQSDSLTVLPIALKHSNDPEGNMPHLGYLLTLAQFRVLILGDADTPGENLDHLQDTGIRNPDVAVIPYWWVTDTNTRGVLSQGIRPRLLVPVHLNRGNRSELVPAINQVAGEFEWVEVPNSLLETVAIGLP